MPEELWAQHLTAAKVAAYVDRQLDNGERDRVEEHLVRCAECRSEVVSVGRAVRKLRRPRPWTIVVPLAAAAVLFVLIAPWRQHAHDPLILREPAVTTILAPTPLTPRGGIAELNSIIWSSVPGARRYQVTVFDTAGVIVWEADAVDSVVHVPASVPFARGKPYYWKVAARTAANRWAASDLTTFTIGSAGAR